MENEVLYTAWGCVEHGKSQRISPVNGFVVTGYRVRIGTTYNNAKDAAAACRLWLKETYGDVELDHDDGSQFHHPNSGTNKWVENDAFVYASDPCPGIDRI